MKDYNHEAEKTLDACGLEAEDDKFIDNVMNGIMKAILSTDQHNHSMDTETIEKAFEGKPARYMAFIIQTLIHSTARRERLESLIIGRKLPDGVRVVKVGEISGEEN